MQCLWDLQSHQVAGLVGEEGTLEIAVRVSSGSVGVRGIWRGHWGAGGALQGCRVGVTRSSWCCAEMGLEARRAARDSPAGWKRGQGVSRL